MGPGTCALQVVMSVAVVSQPPDPFLEKPAAGVGMSNHTPPAWWVTSPLTRVLISDPAPPPGPERSEQAGLHAQRGEIESVLVHIAAASDVIAAAPVLTGSVPAGVQMDWRKVVHVWCAKSSIYPAVSSRWGDRWIPDALADPT